MAGTDGYNYTSACEGPPRLRQKLGAFLGGQYGLGHAVPEGELMLTAGASQALELCCTQLDLLARRRAGTEHAEATDVAASPVTPPPRPAGAPPLRGRSAPGVVFVESPCYLYAMHTFKQRGWRVVDVACAADGGAGGNRSIDIAALEAQLEAHGVPAFLYTTPAHHNPTGWVMPDAKRQALLGLAERWGLHIVADDVYQFMSFPPARAGAQPRAFGALIVEGGPAAQWVVSLGSASKVLAPGLRVGWAHAGAALVAGVLAQAGAALSGGGYTGMNAGIAIECLVDAHFPTLLEAMLQRYGARCAALLAAMDEFLAPLGVAYTCPQGGYFVWCTLPPTLSAVALADALRGAVCFKLGTDFYSNAAIGAREFRLCFVPSDADVMRRGVSLLADAVRAQLAEGA
eukprot:TRINITY_DN5997_c4_g1_i1.p1 TRINITY_DN5997_c4_g1~~TRINITY_DN5997_c4_g1_i1.p1  ORF type:complete len:450 (+),score=112.86 TRINITY_DN5997_c4_g1_i1:145-1350(+)